MLMKLNDTEFIGGLVIGIILGRILAYGMWAMIERWQEKRGKW